MELRIWFWVQFFKYLHSSSSFGIGSKTPVSIWFSLVETERGAFNPSNKVTTQHWSCSKFGNLKILFFFFFFLFFLFCHFEKNSPSGNFFPSQKRSCCFYFLIFSYIAYSLLLQLYVFGPLSSWFFFYPWLLQSTQIDGCWQCHRLSVDYFFVFKLKSEDLSELETCHVPS